MPENTDIVPLLIGSRAGIKRDGTQFEGDNFIDGEWVRFQRGFPRKMLGYNMVSGLPGNHIHGINSYDKSGYVHLHLGSSSLLQRILIDQNSVATTPTDRTPAGFVTSDYNNWQFAALYNSGGTNVALVAHAAPNLNDITSSVTRAIWYGDITGTAVLTQLTGVDVPAAVCGGVCAVPPYLFAYCSDGYLTWSAPNTPTDFSTVSGGGGPNGARVCADKIVRGLPVRGGPGNSPSALFWSLSSLVRLSYVGGTPIFDSDIISTEINVMSSNSMIEFDGVYYWVGTNRFFMYNGTVQELDNPMSTDWFFDNINMAQRQKVFVVKVPRFGEIWFCFPFGDATDCTHALIYNVRESKRLGYGVWYDTLLPNGGRTSAEYSNFLGSPLMTGSVLNPVTSKYDIWRHEVGYDEVSTQTKAIRGYIETADICNMFPPGGGMPRNDALRLDRVELDMIQEQDMMFNITGRRNPRASNNDTPLLTFEPGTEMIYPKTERRIMRFRFESNVAGGYFEMGQCIAHVGPGTGTVKA